MLLSEINSSDDQGGSEDELDSLDIMGEIESVTRNVVLMEDLMEQTSGVPPVAQAIRLPCVAHKVSYNCLN